MSNTGNGQATERRDGAGLFFIDQTNGDQTNRGQANEALGEAVASLQRGDPLRPVTVIGPSGFANLELRRELGRSGLCNVRFMVLPRLAELLAAPALAAQGRRPLTPVLESASVRAVCAQAAGPLREQRLHPSTIRSLARTFRELRPVSEDALAILEGEDGLRAEVVRLYRAFRERTATGFYDREDLALAAAEAVRSSHSLGLADLGFVVFYKVRRLTRGEMALIEALAAAGQCSVYLDLTGDESADAPAHLVAERLAHIFGPAQSQWLVASGQRPERLRDDDGVPSSDCETLDWETLLVAPDPHQEIRSAIRHIVQQADAGVPFHRMALLYRSREPYGVQLLEELKLAGIPITGPNPATLASTGAGRALTGLLRLCQGGFMRDEVMAWLTGCPVGSAGRKINPSLWDAISRDAGVVGGRDQWTQRLHSFAEGLEQAAANAPTRGELSEHQIEGIRYRAKAARELQDFVETLAGDTTPPSGDNTWGGLAGWASGLLDRYLDLGPDAPETGHAAHRQVSEILSEVGHADFVDVQPDFAAFEQVFQEALQVSPGRIGETGRGVFVAPVGAAAGMSFDVVHIVGLVEGAFPPPQRDDSLLPERARAASSQSGQGSGAGLPLRDYRASEERYTFLAALHSAPVRWLSCPASDPIGGREQHPSRWFLERASNLSGQAVYPSTLGGLASQPWLTILGSMDKSLDGVDRTSVADLHDYDLDSMRAWQKSGASLDRHPMAAGDGPLAKPVQLARLRYGGAFTLWDGNVADAIVNQPRLAPRRPLSATSLEAWATCPFSYFLSRVLGLRAVEKPEDRLSLSPVDRGTLVHAILENFVGEAINQNTAPRPDQAWNDAHRRRLMEIAEARFDEVESRGMTGRDLMWQMDKANIRADLHRFLEEDSRLRYEHGVTPAWLEAGFGVAGGWPAAAITLPNTDRIEFRGYIDRVDVSPDGRKALVRDYKTGSSSGYTGMDKDPIQAGQRLQLAIYSLAVQSGLSEDVDVNSAYWFISNRGGFSMAPKSPMRLADVKDEFDRTMSLIVSGIDAGVFPANPGNADRGSFANCKYCDFDALCPSKRDLLWQRKSGDSAVRPYAELATAEDE